MSGDRVRLLCLLWLVAAPACVRVCNYIKELAFQPSRRRKVCSVFIFSFYSIEFSAELLKLNSAFTNLSLKDSVLVKIFPPVELSSLRFFL